MSGEGTELATGIVLLQPSAKGILPGLKAELGGPLEAAGTEAGDKASKSFGSRFTSGIKVGLAGVGAAVGIGIGLEKIGAQFDEAFDHIRVGTGATGKQLAGLQGDFKSVVSSVPTNFASASSAITLINQRLGLTGKPLQGLSEDFLNLSRITKTDVTSGIDSATKVFGQWNISSKNQATTLNQLFRASQASGVGIDSLTGSVTKFGAPLRALGFNFQQSISLIAQLGKSGANTNIVMTGLKTGVANLAKSGQNVPATFSKVVAEITKLGPGTAATAAAIKLFGARAGPELASDITSGKLGIQDMLKTVVGGKDTIQSAAKDTEHWGEQWKLVKNKIAVAIQPLASAVFDFLGSAISRVTPLIGFFTKGLGSLAKSAEGVVGPAIKSIGSTLSKIDWGAVFGKVASILSPVLKALESLGKSVISFATAAWPKLERGFATVLPVLQTVATVIGGAVVGAVKGLSDVISFVAQHMTGLLQVIAPLVVAFAAYELVTTAITVGTEAWAAIQAILDVDLTANPIGLIVAAIAALVAGVILAYQHVAVFRDVVQAVGNFFTNTLWPILELVGSFIATVFTGAVSALAAVWRDVLSPVISFIGALFRNVIIPVIVAVIGFFVSMGSAVISAGAWAIGALTSVVSFVIGLPGRIGHIIATLWDGLKTGVTAAATWVGQKIDAVVGFVTGIPGRIGSLLKGVADLISKPFKSAFNAIADLWNDTIGSLSFHVPSWVPGIGGDGFSVPKIPTFHTGGIIPGPIGQEILIKAQSGEEIIPIGGSSTADALPAQITGSKQYHLHLEGTNDQVDVIAQFHLLEMLAGPIAP